MMDADIKKLMDNCNNVWKVLAEVLDDDSMHYGDCANLMLTLNARYLNGLNKIAQPGFDEFKEIIKKEYIKLITEKLG